VLRRREDAHRDRQRACFVHEKLTGAKSRFLHRVFAFMVAPSYTI